MFFHRLLIKIICLPFNNPQGILGAFPKACAQTVAILVGYQAGLAINYFNRTLSA
jgi:hypothetical protein